MGAQSTPTFWTEAARKLFDTALEKMLISERPLSTKVVDYVHEVVEGELDREEGGDAASLWSDKHVDKPISLATAAPVAREVLKQVRLVGGLVGWLVG